MVHVTPSDRIDLRRSLMNLGSLMLLMVLCTGIAGLFAVWSLNAFHQRVEQTLIESAAALDQARRAQSAFKTQVQEWKNILLRGQVQADRERYVAAFEARRQETVALLQALPERMASIRLRTRAGEARPVFQLDDSVDIPGTLAALSQLNEVYARALARANAAPTWNPTLADSEVRGADRQIGERMDAIPVALVAATESALGVMRRAEDAWFETLSRVIWGVVVVALGVVALVLWRILRHPGLAR